MTNQLGRAFCHDGAPGQCLRKSPRPILCRLPFVATSQTRRHVPARSTPGKARCRSNSIRRILALNGREIFTAYVPGPKGPVFMPLIEKSFGKDVTTRTWDTVKKCAVA
jgi:hypothetical protein